MNNKQIIPVLALRKFDYMCLHNVYLRRNKELQQQILSWASDMLTEDRDIHGKICGTMIDAAVKEDRRSQAKKRGQARDNKYAPFREYFKNLQYKKFTEAKNKGYILKASVFLQWFWMNEAERVIIPYKKGNQYHKLLELAQENNREFKKYS